MGRIAETWGKVAFKYVVPLELGVIAFFAVHLAAEHDHNNTERDIHRCAGKLGAVVMKSPEIPEECTWAASQFAATSNSKTSVSGVSSITETTTTYTLSDRKSFVQKNQHDEDNFENLALFMEIGVGVAVPLTFGAVRGVVMSGREQNTTQPPQTSEAIPVV